MIEPIDLNLDGVDRIVCAYLLETTDGPALFDCGPSSTLPRLKEGLRSRGIELEEIRHLLLSHIHLDHAGAAGAIVRTNTEMTVWVSHVGAPHIVDPSRLERSARRLYGDAFDSLWGELAPVPERNVRIADGDVLGLEAFPTPGHASHHVSYFDPDGTLWAGDAVGVRIEPSRYVFPGTPPPDVDIDAWRRTIASIAERHPERMALIHYGVATDVDEHLHALTIELEALSTSVHDGMAIDDYVLRTRGSAEDPDRYDRAAPFDQAWQGLRRYWDKQATSA